jgi:methyl-accepting chemotaxis protein
VNGNPLRASETEAGDALGAYLRLEEAIDSSLQGVIADTESSAQSIIKQLRRLHDSAVALASYLDGTDLQGGDLGKEIIESVAFLSDVGAFIERLPGKMERDLSSVQSLVAEIRFLSEMTSDVKAISLQSHLLSINAAVEATRAGAVGSAFKVVAEEMRRLATNSSAMAVKINKGLARAQMIVETGVQSTIKESAEQLADVTKATATIGKLQSNFEDMSQYYKTRFSVVMKHNDDLVRDIVEALGQVQYQDVVRQTIERIRSATERRNAALRTLLLTPCGDQEDADLPVQLELILDDYLAEDAKHRHSVRQTQGVDAPLKVELF